MQAEKDLEHARKSADMGDFEWSCFAAQQSAEKAVKAIYLALGQEAWGHSVLKLLKELPIDVPSELIEKAKVLDQYYIPTRYPNSFPEGIPSEFFGEKQAKEAVSYASEILEFARYCVAKKR